MAGSAASFTAYSTKINLYFLKIGRILTPTRTPYYILDKQLNIYAELFTFP